MSIIIGLTGPTGAGKSSICETAGLLGFQVIDCDAVARRVVESDAVISALCSHFGNDIVKDGRLDRRLLAAKAFATAEGKAALDRITLPPISAQIEREISAEHVLLDAPTLFESGLDRRCNAVIGVLADKVLRKKRIIERDSLKETDADRRLSAAQSDGFFKVRCDYIIYNNGDLAELNAKAREILLEVI